MYTPSQDSEIIAKYMENWKYGPEDKEEVLEKYRKLFEEEKPKTFKKGPKKLR